MTQHISLSSLDIIRLDRVLHAHDQCGCRGLSHKDFIKNRSCSGHIENRTQTVLKQILPGMLIKPDWLLEKGKTWIMTMMLHSSSAF
jgi:hypothetical protein